MRLAHERAALADEHQILAPTLLRSHVLSSLYQAVQRGELTKRDADELGWPDTFDAEYVALTQLQADAFVTLDRRLAAEVTELVNVAPIEDLY